MTIKSLKHDYFVLVMLEQNIKYDIMLASYDNAGNPSEIFSIICIKDNDIVMGLAPFFLEVDYAYFTDFSECFILESNMLLVFRYEHQSEAEILSNCVTDMKLVQRLKIAKSILSKLILQRTPYPVMCAILNPDNIVVSSDTYISFNYFVVNFNDYQPDCKNKAMICLAYLLGFLFEKEITYKQSAGLNDLIFNIQSNTYNDMTQVYKEFIKTYDELALLDEMEPDKPKSIVERMEEFRSRVLVKFKPALAFIIVFIGLFYLYTTISQSTVPTQRGSIEAIGEFIIE